VTFQKEISFHSKGSYSVLGDLDSTTTHTILFVFHGQGQLAKYFIRKFKSLKDLGITIIAPEGLHHYYLSGFSGRVGASWMTNENRLVAIENYLTFLDSTLKDVLKTTPSDVNIHLLGFSQGAATACRWVEKSNFNFDKLILWGGGLPPDLESQAITNRMKGKSIIQMIGNKDPYLTPENKRTMLTLIEKYNLSSTIKQYNGEHNINEATLLELFNFSSSTSEENSSSC